MLHKNNVLPDVVKFQEKYFFYGPTATYSNQRGVRTLISIRAGLEPVTGKVKHLPQSIIFPFLLF